MWQTKRPSRNCFKKIINFFKTCFSQLFGCLSINCFKNKQKESLTPGIKGPKEFSTLKAMAALAAATAATAVANPDKVNQGG